jgi:hypothetical protein
MDGHLTSQDFAAVATGELPKERVRAVLSHLLRGCKICQAGAATLWRLGGQADSIPEDAYEAALDQALAAVEREHLLQQVSLAA